MVLDKPIIAVDFDGTITTGDTRIWIDDIPSEDIFFENIVITDFIRRVQHNVYLILWTCRTGESLTRAIKFCKSIGIKFDAINENLPGMFETSRKIYADMYLDDKSCFNPEEAYTQLYKGE